MSAQSSRSQQSSRRSANKSAGRGHGFGVAPVFLAAISTILGAVMFLRFGYAVGHVGLLGALGIIALGHLVTIPTAMAVSEIATNRRVEGGGEYYIISRSFGTTIGGTIGVSLYLSQAISAAFYMIAFAEAFKPLFPWIEQAAGFAMDPRYLSAPATVLLLALILTRGAALGVKALWVVSVVLALSLAAFFAGSGGEGAPTSISLTDTVEDPGGFALVFAICFPAFTGMTAGVGLSGDLRDPRHSIPLGTMAATLAGMAIYVLIAFKLAANAMPADLANTNELIMARVSIWPPMILIGLGAATLSSALGSVMVAPRTLQALARDRVLPFGKLNDKVAEGRGAADEPVAATMATGALAMMFVLAGDVDFVAQIISMFFMVTYGAICSISFLEYFAGNPSYRPTFRSRWYVSVLGALMCFLLMFQMQPIYAALSLAVMVVIYQGLRYSRKGERDLTAILQGVMFQLTRRLHIAVQQSRSGTRVRDWRPSFVAVTRSSGERIGQFDLLRWICHRHGFGQYIQYVEGELTIESEVQGRLQKEQLIAQGEASGAGLLVDTLVAPTYQLALTELLQRPGVSGMPNNSVLFEFPKDETNEIDEVQHGAELVSSLGYNACVLRSSDFRFGYRRSIHIWLAKDDLTNAPLMILLAYIISGHPDWKDASISIFASYPTQSAAQELDKLQEMIREGRLPIPSNRVISVPYDDESSFEKAVNRHSPAADLVILGLSYEEILKNCSSELTAYASVRDALFVHASEQISIS